MARPGRLAGRGHPEPDGLGPLRDDGLPTLPTGEPVLARWFVVLMLVLVPAGIAAIVWVFTSVDREPLPAAERRPTGTEDVTHDRGDAALTTDRTAEPGPGCAAGIEVVGDPGSRAAGRRALSATCQLLDRPAFADAAQGMARWLQQDGLLRFAVFERNGLDSSARVEDGRVVVELNAKFQFRDATEAAPVVLHELAHLGASWPGTPVTAEQELAAMRLQGAACGLLTFREQPPRSCLDATQLLGGPDPLGALLDAGYGR